MSRHVNWDWHPEKTSNDIAQLPALCYNLARPKGQPWGVV